MDLSIIIVSYNVKDKLRQNLQALFSEATNLAFEVWVVDNNSSDDSLGMVKQEFPQVRLISNQTNLGFAKANNQAIREAKGDFILLLNPDMQVAPVALANLWQWGKNNSQAVVFGGQLIDQMGDSLPSVRRFPKIFDQLAVLFKLPHLFPKIINHYLATDFNYNQAQAVDSVRGSFFFINRAAWQKISGSSLPLLDERYFIWFEEVDFCRQVYKLGGEVWYTPTAECLDYVGASFNQVKLKQKQKYVSDSMLKYFQKWEKPWKYGILKIVWVVIRIFI